VGLGADQLVGRVLTTGGDNVIKVSFWWDALKVIRAHPGGIGLGAFGRVYPIYQTVAYRSWIQFIENQPLGLLIEGGIPGAVLTAATLVVVVRQFLRHSRGDRVEASLVAGLVAVMAHNLVDFGLEVPGVLLPFCALLGAVFGRQATVSSDGLARRRSVVTFAAVAVASIAVGIVLLTRPATRDFDALLRNALPAGAPSLARAASTAHPTDHAYALVEARLQPKNLASAATRMRMINRAITLCPLCADGHAQAARELWHLGRRQQALLEWRSVLKLAPTQLRGVFDELLRSRANPTELASLGTDENLLELSQHMLGAGMVDTARLVMAQSNDRGADFHLVEAQIALKAGDLPAARAASQRALAAAPQDPRAALMAAEVETRANDFGRAEEALRAGLRGAPTDVDLNRKLLALLMQTDRWQATDKALAGLREALVQSGAPMAEANVATARIAEQRGQYHRAVVEYQAALAQAPNDAGLALLLGRAAEQAGSIATARDAYNSALKQAPDNAEARAALERIRRDKKLLEVIEAQASHTWSQNKDDR
jgi:tetratricopeptide (TPR) repeat protein